MTGDYWNRQGQYSLSSQCQDIEEWVRQEQEQREDY